MFQDFAARSLGVRNRHDAHRLAVIDTLSRGIASHLPLGLPGVMETPIEEDRASSTQIESGTTYGFSGSNPAADFSRHYSFYGGAWEPYVTVFRRSITGHLGNGTDPSAGAVSSPNTVRFMTQAPKFEIYAANYLGFRVKVNGRYAKTGLYGVQALNSDGSAGSGRWWQFDFEDTEFAGDALKLVEIQGHAEFRFGGVRVPMGSTVSPWPQSVPLKVALHGDSKVTSVSDSADYRTAPQGLMTHIVQALTGASDVWANNIGGAGFYANQGGTRSNFIEQAAVDFSGQKFDVVWETGGVNDAGLSPVEADYKGRVATWLGQVLADNPDTIVVMTGPLPKGSGEDYSTSSPMALIQRAKKAAAALYPRNCAFIETIGNATIGSDAWVFGTGKAGSTAGNGNADLVTGPDGTHPTVFGHQYLGTRLVSATARVLPLLASRIRNGVTAGVNDLDLV